MAKLCLKPRKYDQLDQYRKYLIANAAAQSSNQRTITSTRWHANYNAER